MPAQGKPSIVFCRGIWADGSCLSTLISSASRRGAWGP
jgi:hypothetical protein